MKEKSYDERIAVFKDKAHKQLLVAMREATEGEDFEKIIVNEYEEVPSSLAQKAYLIICGLHRLGVKVRAGLLRRLIDISFEDIGEKILTPCERVIVVEENESTRSIYYRSRHSYIAETVCRNVLRDPEQLSEFYMNVLDNMDLGYNSDYYAFRVLVRAGAIIDAMPNIEHRRLFYQKALKLSGDDAYVYQQFGIMEMRYGNLDEAEEYVAKACRTEPKNHAYKHSHALLLYQKSQSSSNVLIKERLFNKSQTLLVEIMTDWPTNPYAYNSYAQNIIEKAKKGEAANREEKLKEAHDTVLSGIRYCYDKSTLYTTEGRIFESLGEFERAKQSLLHSHALNPSNVRTATFLGRFLIRNKDYPLAYKIVEQSIKYNELNVNLNILAAEILKVIDPKNHKKIISFLKKAFDPSFIDASANYMLAVEYFRIENYSEADKIFNSFRKRTPFKRDSESYKIREYLKDDKENNRRIQGEIINIYGNRGFIKADLFPIDIFFHLKNDRPSVGSSVVIQT